MESTPVFRTVAVVERSVLLLKKKLEFIKEEDPPKFEMVEIP
jgi:hypothetical protein